MKKTVQELSENTTIIAKSGIGMSHTSKEMLLEQRNDNQDLQVIVVDPEQEFKMGIDDWIKH